VGDACRPRSPRGSGSFEIPSLGTWGSSFDGRMLGLERLRWIRVDGQPGMRRGAGRKSFEGTLDLVNTAK